MKDRYWYNLMVAMCSLVILMILSALIGVALSDLFGWDQWHVAWLAVSWPLLNLMVSRRNLIDERDLPFSHFCPDCGVTTRSDSQEFIERWNFKHRCEP